MRYGTMTAWAEYFEREEGVSTSICTIRNRLKETGKIGKDGKDKIGRIFQFYSEADVREACADLFLNLPQLDANGFFEQDGEIYASTRSWAEYFKDVEKIGISTNTIASKLKESGITGITARASNGQIHENAYFSKSDVLEACKDLLTKFPQANEDGFFELDGERYASARTWSEYFKETNNATTRPQTITKRLKAAGITGIIARNSQGRFYRCAYFSESDLLETCRDLLANLPQCDKDGFFELDGEIYASTVTWSRYLEDTEKVAIGYRTIGRRLRKADITGITARNSRGIICESTYFPKSDVLEISKDLPQIQECPQANEDGFFELDGERYASTITWSEYFKETENATACPQTITKRLKAAGITGITAKNAQGKIYKDAYFPKSDVLEACKDLLTKFPQVNEDGFFELDGERYASVGTWSEEKLIGLTTIREKLRTAGIMGITAKDSLGRIWENIYFSESDVLEACENLLQRIPQANEDGFFELDGERYASTVTWSKYFKDTEGVITSNSTIVKRSKEAGITGVTAKNASGRLCENAYFSKSDVYRACRDLLKKLPQIDKDGFFELNGEHYASIGTWLKYFKSTEGVVIGRKTVGKKLRKAGIIGITARDSGGKIWESSYYPESAVRQACADLLTKRKT